MAQKTYGGRPYRIYVNYFKVPLDDDISKTPNWAKGLLYYPLSGTWSNLEDASASCLVSQSSALSGRTNTRSVTGVTQTYKTMRSVSGSLVGTGSLFRHASDGVSASIAAGTSITNVGANYIIKDKDNNLAWASVIHDWEQYEKSGSIPALEKKLANPKEKGAWAPKQPYGQTNPPDSPT